VKYPKKMELKLASGDTLTIDLLNVKYNPACNWFVAEIRISSELIDLELNKNTISFETEEK